jgi:hypothetical protein
MISPDPYVGKVLTSKRPDITELFLDERLGKNSLIIPAGTLIHKPKRHDSTLKASQQYRSIAQGYILSNEIPTSITLTEDLYINPQMGIWLLTGTKRRSHAQRYLRWNDENQLLVYNKPDIIYDKVKYNTKMSFHEIMMRCGAEWVVPNYTTMENNFNLTIPELYELNTFTKTQPVAFTCYHCDVAFIKSISEVRENILDGITPCPNCARQVYNSSSSFTERRIILNLMKKGYVVYTGNLSTFPTLHPLWKTRVLNLDGIIKLSNGLTVAFDFDGQHWHDDTDRDSRKVQVILDENHADYYIRMRDNLPPLVMDSVKYIELTCKTDTYNNKTKRVEYNPKFMDKVIKEIDSTLQELIKIQL